MSALLELIKEAPPEDRKAAAELLKPYFDEPQAKQPAIPTLISLEQFRCQYGHRKSPAWCRLYLLPKMPGVYGLNQGKGHPVKIDVEKATRWLTQYEEEIDWNQPLPR